MAGSDQSVNLGGMLGQIAETVGTRAEAYAPVMKAATKPRGSMDDPAHLQRLAQWATDNGDAAQASMYMSQSRELKAEQKEAKNVAFVGKTGQIAAQAQQRAQEGDVNNLDRTIAELKERVELATQSGSAAQLNSAQSALKGAIASRDKATEVQVGNHIKAIGAIDEVLADPAQANREIAVTDASGKPVIGPDGKPQKTTVGAELTKRRDELLKDQKVSDGIIEREVSEFQQREAEKTVRTTEFLDGNKTKIREAISNGDEGALQDIKDSMPTELGVKGETAFLDYVEDMRKIEDGNRDRAELADMSKPYDFEQNNDRIAQLEEKYPELLAPVKAAEAQLRSLESDRGAGGTVLLPGKVRTARENLNKVINAQLEKAAGIDLRVRLEKEDEQRTAVEGLERKRDAGYKPRPEETRAAVSARLRYDEEYQEAEAAGDFKDMQARAEAVEREVLAAGRQAFENDINDQLRALGVEVEEPEQAQSWTNSNGGTVSLETVQRGLAQVGKKKFVETLLADGFTVDQIEDMLGEELEDVDAGPAEVPKRLSERDAPLPGFFQRGDSDPDPISTYQANLSKKLGR